MRTWQPCRKPGQSPPRHAGRVARLERLVAARLRAVETGELGTDLVEDLAIVETDRLRISAREADGICAAGQIGEALFLDRCEMALGDFGARGNVGAAQAQPLPGMPKP